MFSWMNEWAWPNPFPIGTPPLHTHKHTHTHTHQAPALLDSPQPDRLCKGWDSSAHRRRALISWPSGLSSLDKIWQVTPWQNLPLGKCWCWGHIWEQHICDFTGFHTKRQSVPVASWPAGHFSAAIESKAGKATHLILFFVVSLNVQSLYKPSHHSSP